MKSVIIVLVISGIFIAIYARPDSDHKPSLLKFEHVGNLDDVMGISSVAGITSRNGRVSSLGGITFYPRPDSVTREYFFPLTVSSEQAGKYAWSTIQHHPGFISTSAAAGFRPPKVENRKRFPSKPIIPKLLNEFFVEPPPKLFKGDLENWITKDFFNNFPSYNPREFRNKWFMSAFNPFMNWR